MVKKSKPKAKPKPKLGKIVREMLKQRGPKLAANALLDRLKSKRRKKMADTGRSYVKPDVKPVAKPAAKPAGMAKPDANPWRPVTDPAPEGKVLEIDGYDDNKPELAVKTGGVWRSYVEGDKTKPVATQAPVEVVGPRRWRLRTAK